jgi:hypothetical protein
MGRTDVEDSLQRLDKLTQEEAQMAAAELRVVVHNVDGKMTNVEKGVEGVGRGVEDVGNKVQGVGDKVDQVDRSSFLVLFPLILSPHKSSKGTISETAFEFGFLLQIHQQIIILPAMLITRDRRNGSLMALSTINGRLRVLSCGFTVNVRF